MKSRMMLFFVVLMISCSWGQDIKPANKAQILVGQQAPEMERYAARELQRYLYQLTGTLLPIQNDDTSLDRTSFVIGTRTSNAHVRQLAQQGSLSITAKSPGAQGYVLKSIKQQGGGAVLAIAGADTIGCLYGVYGLLDEHYDVGFYPAGDILPDKKVSLSIPKIDETKTPAMAIRGYLPWTNFPQSATVFSWEDWKFVLDQCAKMRMNFIHIHNYNKTQGHYPRRYTEHNEMFHSFSFNGLRQRPWMPSVTTGHPWCMPGWEVKEYRFDAQDLFDDYDFGADCTLHNDSYSNDETFLKGSSEFQKVINYAHARGIKMGLGLDIDLVPRDLGAEPNDPAILKSRADQIINDYPDLDYLLCFQSEKHSAWTGPEYKQWREIFRYLYDEIKARSPHTRLAVSGWGLNPESIETLPEDVICAPIARYGASFENGEIYGDREYWGCPWLETDGNCSQHYYPYNCHLSTTIESYQKRAPNMKGLYCLTWRISDAIEPKLSYIAKVPWDAENKYQSSYDVYHEYAQRAYGQNAAKAITAIINEDEAFAEDHGECRHIPIFTGSDRMAIQAPLIEAGALNFYDAQDNEVLSVSPNREIRRYGAIIGVTDEENEGTVVKQIATGNWYELDVDLPDEVQGFELRVKAPRRDCDIEIRQHAFNGPLLGTTTAKVDGSWQTVRGTMSPLKGKQRLALRFLGQEQNDRDKVAQQLKVIDQEIAQASSAGNKYRLGLLRERLRGVQTYIDIDRDFQAISWEQMPGAFEPWMKSFMHRVYDISSLGNITSVQNRFVKVRYLAREKELRALHKVQAPDWVKARGTVDGVIIEWQNKEQDVLGYHVYRDGQRINEAIIPAHTMTFADKTIGTHRYQVTALNQQGQESPFSMPSICPAGNADTTPPYIVLVSPPTSLEPGQALDVKVRLLDDRSYDSVTAQFFYRQPGQSRWQQIPMERRTKSIFGVRLAGDIMTKAGLEYYVRASDGSNVSHYPAAAPERSLSTVAWQWDDNKTPVTPKRVTVSDQVLTWKKPKGDVFWYRIYRSQDKNFTPGPANALTYVPVSITRFKDNGYDWDGQPLTGTWYYRMTAQDKFDNESKATKPIAVKW